MPIHWLTTKNVAGSDNPSSTGAAFSKLSSIPVVERNRQLAIQLLSTLEPTHELPERHDLEVVFEELAVAFERGNADRQPFKRGSVADAMKRHDDRGIPQQDAAEA